MKKVKNKKLYKNITLLASGALIIATTPVAKDLIQFLLTHDCPVVGSRGIRECGLDRGLDNASILIGLMSLWLVAGFALLTVGMIAYFSAKKKL